MAVTRAFHAGALAMFPQTDAFTQHVPLDSLDATFNCPRPMFNLKSKSISMKEKKVFFFISRVFVI
jgi:hypothetical protein